MGRLRCEHRAQAYLNLKKGIRAPRSGSARQNGTILSEQIGGQIFIDTWGLCWPGDSVKAAGYGEIAASVSHDGEGINGARFFCACIAEAFVSNDIGHIIETGLAQIPEDSRYMAVARAVSCLNILDIPSFAKEVAFLGYRVNGQTPPDGLKQSICDGEIHFDFELPGAGAGFQPGGKPGNIKRGAYNPAGA